MVAEMVVVIGECGGDYCEEIEKIDVGRWRSLFMMK